MRSITVKPSATWRADLEEAVAEAEAVRAREEAAAKVKARRAKKSEKEKEKLVLASLSSRSLGGGGGGDAEAADLASPLRPPTASANPFLEELSGRLAPHLSKG